MGTAGAAIIGGLLGNNHANSKKKEGRRRSGSGTGRRHRRSLSRDSRDGRDESY